jgi:CHASE2 domain-containing sensor protein
MKKINKTLIGIIFGIIAGIIDIIPMIFQKLSWDANLSAFSMWIIAGFIISTSNIKINSILKGILISFLLLTPAAILIGWHQPISLIPIFLMTLILGSLLGYFINRFTNK